MTTFRLSGLSGSSRMKDLLRDHGQLAPGIRDGPLIALSGLNARFNPHRFDALPPWPDSIARPARRGISRPGFHRPLRPTLPSDETAVRTWHWRGAARLRNPRRRGARG